MPDKSYTVYECQSCGTSSLDLTHFDVTLPQTDPDDVCEHTHLDKATLVPAEQLEEAQQDLSDLLLGVEKLGRQPSFGEVQALVDFAAQLRPKYENRVSTPDTQQDTEPFQKGRPDG